LFLLFSIIASSLSSHSLATDYWLLFSCHGPLSSRFTPHPHAALRWNQRGQVMRKPSRASISVTDRRIAKDRTGPDLDGPPYLIMSPNQAIPADKSNNSSSSRSLPTNRWPFFRGRKRSTPPVPGVPGRVRRWRRRHPVP